MLQEQLTMDEKNSLKELTKHLLQERIPDVHTKKFLSLGLAEQKLGGLKITHKGLLALKRR
ncbi:hypothetical protein [Vampirovibrio chlorellavorus]|uniref:hypothetical protein n=1 Tax=Vampirovibrio chlorellavorus TaxID=758823 RepID=UPI0026EF0601|nr:hypothetical protein [Vampirovibrio chlorellavorus]